MNAASVIIAAAFLLSQTASGVVYRLITGDNTAINSDWSAAEGPWSYSTVISGSPAKPWITATQHFSGEFSLGLQVPTDTTGSKERFEYEILPASEPNGLHFDNARYSGFVFKLGAPVPGFGSSTLFWQAWQGSPWGPPASLKLTSDNSAPFTIGLYVRNMATGPDSAISDTRLWSSAIIQPDTWYRVVIYLEPRFTNNNGNIKLWINGTNVVDCTTNIGYDPALVSGALNGLDIKNGIYQPDSNNGHTFFFDQIIVATTFAEASSLPAFTNTPPTAGPGITNTHENAYVDFDLRGLIADSQTPTTRFRITAGPATNGSVGLLPDGHTARFTPAMNFVGSGGFSYVATDQGEDGRIYLHYSFELPELFPADSVTDASLNTRDGSVILAGSGTISYSTDVPFPGFGSNSAQLIQLGTTGAACVTRLISPQFNLSDHDWTFSCWFQRLATSDHDFIFYIGTGNGFGGDGDEFQFYCPGSSASLRVQHYNASNVLDVDVSSPAAAAPHQWHHAALVFDRSASNSGTLRAFLDGVPFGADTNVTWALQQQQAVVFGGHNQTNSATDRWFNGYLDDIALFTNALSDQEILALASETVANFGGLNATNSVSVIINPYSQPVLSSFGLSNGVWTMTVSGDAGPAYVLQASTNLTTPGWVAIATNPAANPPFLFRDPTPASDRHFYRVVVVP